MTPRPNVESLSPNEKKLRQLDRRDKLMRVFETCVLTFLVLFNIISLLRVQQVIRQNQQSAVQSREANFQRQSEIKAYIKCIVLIRYDNPGLSQDSPRQDVENALDKCVNPKK